MINGDVNEFVERISHGDELWFIYKGDLFFLEGLTLNGESRLYLYNMSKIPRTGIGEWFSEPISQGQHYYPVQEFLNLRIWDGKTFWEAENIMEWTDYGEAEAEAIYTGVVKQ